MTPAASSVLVVDDSELNRDMLSRRLQRNGFSVAIATNGAEALDLVDRLTVDAILLDLMMPGMNGFDVLARIRQSRSVADLPIIIVTSRDDTEDVVRGLQLGANDYVTKPVDFAVLLARLQTQISLKRAKRALELAHARMKTDLESAAKLQLALMPRRLPPVPRVGFGWKFRPCDELAGDILDIVPLDERSVGLYLLDVSGHGVPAALLSVTLSRVLSHMADGYSPLRDAVESGALSAVAKPAQVAARLNRQFPMDPATRQYFTFLYGVLDVNDRVLQYVAAGHPGPVYLPRGGDPVILDAAGFAIGWFPDAEFRDQTVQLHSGDRLFFYSDGVIEAKADNDELFGKSRLLQTIVRSRELPLQGSLDLLLNTVVAWCGLIEPDDDISLLGLEIQP